MSRARSGPELLAVLLAALVALPTVAFAQSGAAAADAADEVAPAEEYEYAADDDDDYDYVDIDSYGVEGTSGAAEDAATAGAGTAGSAAAAAAGAGDAGSPAAARADQGRSFGGHLARAGEVTMDVLILRPFGAVATVAGSGFLLAASPFLIISNDFETARDVFVGERARYTFERPLGQF